MYMVDKDEFIALIFFNRFVVVMNNRINNTDHKRSKIFNTRVIRTENADPSIKDGVLSVPDFLKAREFEINSFEMSQMKTKYASSNRVFQNLPRSMRRRTASHNVKRIPKRLRNRAIREMQDTNVIKKKVNSKEVYRIKMAKRLLKLASRIKLMKSVPNDSTLPVKQRIQTLNEQLKELRDQKHQHKPTLNNVLGSYDNTGLNALTKKPNGNVKFSKRQKDFVWLSTHIWHAKRFHLIKRWGYQIPLTPTQKCFKSTNRASKSNTIIMDTSYYDSLIFDYDEAILEELLHATKPILNGFKSYNGFLYINSIPVGKCMAYASKSTLKVVLRVHPSIYEQLFTYLKKTYPSVKLQDCRYSLGSIDLLGPTALSTLNKIFHPTSKVPEFQSFSKYNEDLKVGTTFSFSIKDPRLWPKPKTPPVQQEIPYNDLHIKLAKSAVNEESLSQLFDPDSRNESYKDQLPTKLLNSHPNPNNVTQSIPLLLTKTDISWCLIVPWFWVLPIWLQLNKVKHVHLGGLRQLKQVQFESYKPNDIEDLPYLPESWANNELQIRLNQEKYSKLPASKCQTEKFENGLLSFGTDWEFLTKKTFILKSLGKELTTERQFGQFDEHMVKQINSVDNLIDHINATRDSKPSIELFDSNNEFHKSFVQGSYDVQLSSLPKLPVKLIKFELPEGALADNARIYETDSDIQKLVGFVTSGGFNLTRGRPTGLGYIAANVQDLDKLVVRNIGASKVYTITCI